MNTQTEAPTKPDVYMHPDVYILNDLDFELPPPCEHSNHHRRHVPDESASYVIHVKCPKCSDEMVYNICDSGRRDMLTPIHTVGCLKCGYVRQGFEFVIACTPLDSTTH